MVTILPLIRRRSRAPAQRSWAGASDAAASSRAGKRSVRRVMSFLNGVYCLTPVGPNRLIALILLAPALVPAAPAISGEAVYKERCAGCHENDNPRIPHRDVLEKLPA